MGFFRKNRLEKSIDEIEEKEDKHIDIPGDVAVSKKVELIGASLNKVNMQLESLSEVRRSTVQRFAAITEQIGELRGQLMDTNKNISTIEIKSTRAVDLVENVHPDKLLIEIQKEDGKIEAIKANIESNEAMMHNLMDQIKKIRNQMAAYRGIEQVLKMNQEVKDDIINIKKIAVTVEKHSDKVESIFGDMQKTYQEYNMFADSLKDMKKEIHGLSSQVDIMNIRIQEYVDKKEFIKKYSEMEIFVKKLKALEKDIYAERKQYKRDFDIAKKSLRLQFQKELASAKIISDTFERMLMQNPEIAHDLHLKDYIDSRKSEIMNEIAEESPDDSENPTKVITD